MYCDWLYIVIDLLRPTKEVGGKGKSAERREMAETMQTTAILAI